MPLEPRSKNPFTCNSSAGEASHPADFYETLMPSVSFCLFAHPIRLPLSMYISVPPRANKQKIDDFFFACGCCAGVLLDFHRIIARGPEIFTGELGEIDEDGWHYPITG